MRYKFLNQDMATLGEGNHYLDFEVLARTHSDEQWWIYDTTTNTATHRNKAAPLIGKMISGAAAAEDWANRMKPKSKIKQMQRHIDQLVRKLEELIAHG